MRGDSTKNWKEKQKKDSMGGNQPQIHAGVSVPWREEDAFPNNSSAAHVPPGTDFGSLRRQAEQSSIGRQG